MMHAKPLQLVEHVQLNQVEDVLLEQLAQQPLFKQHVLQIHQIQLAIGMAQHVSIRPVQTLLVL